MADAQITVGADASAVQKAFATAKNSVREAASEMASSMGSAARSVIGSFTEVATSQGKVNFQSQHAQVREFEAATAHMATAAGRDLGALRSELEATGKSIGRQPLEVAAWSSEVGKLSYNFKGATEAMAGVSALGAETGRSAEEYKGLASELLTVGKVAGDTTHAVGSISAQAKELGVQGGVAAFADQIQGLGDTISHFAVKSEADFLKVTALAGTLSQGLNPQQASRVQGQALGALAADPLRWERYLGHAVQDEHGEIKDPTQTLKEITEKTKRRYGNQARRVLQLNFGAETGAAMFSANYDEAAKASGLKPSGSPAAAQQAYLATDAGKRDTAAAQLAESSRALMGSSTLLGRAADALQQFAANNPMVSTLATGVGSAAVGFGVSKAGGLLGGLLQGGSKGAIAATAGAAGMTVAGIGAAALGGLALGAYLGDKVNDQLYKEEPVEKRRSEATERWHKIAQERDEARAARGLPPLHGPEHTQNTGAAGHGADGKEITRAVAEGMKAAKFTIMNSTGGPVEVARQGAQSSAAGNQG